MAEVLPPRLQKGSHVIFYKHWPWWKSALGIAPNTKRMVELETEALALEVLQRELTLIEDQYRIKSRKAKMDYLLKWLNKR